MYHMRFILILVVTFFCLSTTAQQKLRLESLTKENQPIIDSLYRFGDMFTLTEIETNVKSINEKLLRKGYFNAKIIPKLSNDTLYVYQVDLGKKVNFLTILIPKDLQDKFDLEPFERLKTSEVEFFIRKIQKKYDALGFVFHQLKLRNFQMTVDGLSAELYVQTKDARVFNEFVWQGIDKFPKNFKKHIYKSYRQLPFSQANIDLLTKEINQFHFCQLIKAPEVLFSKDSTKVYLTLEKKKNNQFDGYAGFSTDENNAFKINGYLDLALSNLLNGGEHIKIYWRNNGEDQTEFQANLDLPFLFGSRFTGGLDLNILQQDSTFQNTLTKLKVGYHLKFSQKVFLGFESNTSNNISNLNTGFISDFNSTYWLFSYTNYPVIMQPFQRNDQLFIFSEVGYGERKSKLANNQQFKIKLDIEKNFLITNKQNLWVKSENFYLRSDIYLANELHRFGGHQSLRGFLDNSLYASQYHALLSEYQYFFNPNFYLHTVSDYAFYSDKTSNVSNHLITMGLGFGLQTRNGIIKFNYVNPIVGFDSFQWSNSLVHIQFKAVF
jgi:hypothetical protein